ncbi:MAG: hypothetical protein XU08_C0001G0190 [candidate division WWE3 bacterium CSP1-7]|uniref:Uncharacterized protein n=1 Tax=candidate division WWE3 bacterium CSP1-7 TaxID=1576480 RepID=A0A0T5ZYA2_UNCKA|nr:MAG: hypothetical protein XU08_C0001G0190 [candidate division WWE3 bacterium CSP1-7]
MTKELGIILTLTLIAVLSWVGWLFFEGASGLDQIDYSKKVIEPLNPILRTDILQ